MKIRDVKKLGSHIVVQGGTFYNEAVLRPYELNVERKVTSADHEFYETAPITKEDSPAWDIDVLKEMNMSVSVEYNIGEHVYEDWEKDLYRESPLYEIAAVKLSSD